MSKLRVFLADDHAVVREGLRSLLNAQTDMEVIGEAADGQAAVDAAAELRPDVIVMDISMPKMGGAEATKLLKGLCPDAKIVALTVHEDRTYLRQLLESGVSGYVLKRAAAEELVHAVRTIAAGGVYLDPTLAGKVVGGFVKKSNARGIADTRDLSEREEEVFRMIAKGASNKEIAALLDISTKTVETYKSRSMEKLGLSSRTDIVRYALQQGWLADV